MKMDKKIKKLDKNSVLTVNLSIAKQFKVRIFIAGQLIKLAAFVLGCNASVNFDDEKGVSKAKPASCCM